MAIYTPVYYSSLGTRYRVDLLAESLAAHGLEVRLVIGQREGILRGLYQKLAAKLLTKPGTWSWLGRMIAREVEAQRPDIAITVSDVTAGAARFLTEAGIRTIVSVEDFTSSYHRRLREDPRSALRVEGILREELGHAAAVITPAYSLSDALESELGVSSVTVPIGLHQNTTEAEAEARPHRWAIHARPVRGEREAHVLTELAGRLSERGVGTIALRAGPRAGAVRGVEWYRFESPGSAAAYGQKAFLGVIAEYRPAYTLSSLYFHASLLQPILALGDGPWTGEARRLQLPLVQSADQVTPGMIRGLSGSVAALRTPGVHDPLWELVKEAGTVSPRN